MSTIDGSEYSAVTIDGQDVTEITVDGAVVWVAKRVIHDFENNNHAGWDVESSTGSDNIVSNGLNGTNYAWRHNGFRQAHLAGADAIDRGPQPGDVFEFWFRVDSASGPVINRFEFSADGHNEPDCYRIEFERGTGDNEFSLEKYVNGSQQKIDTDPGAVSVGQIYRCEVRWNVGNSNVEAQFFYPNGNAASSKLSITDNSSSSGSEFTQPGIFIRTNDNNSCTWDEFVIHT